MSSKDIGSVKALVFDVFGTVVDWRSSVIRELEQFGRSKGIAADWVAIADGWRAGYMPSMDRVRKGELPWKTIDELHRTTLDALLAKHGVAGLSEAEKEHLNRAWHRLSPWPDSLAGLTRLKRRFIIGTLSNGNVALLLNMAKHADLPWDMIFSAELVRRYKPDPETYRSVPELLRVTPGEVMLVAAHNNDLVAAAREGLRTGFVARPTEYGPHQKHDFEAEHEFDVIAEDFVQLAERMGA
ncbi:MAG TPA: haloacid dehalogenase type II [Stellaceae bacterium]|nr:haloacid dehalogenase type II [Stellaceae bacterium]